ncbi:MAG: hypothetical protein R3A11_01500 [Bdellovibrionota bacterium]
MMWNPKEKNAICINPSFSAPQVLDFLEQTKLSLVHIVCTDAWLGCMAHAAWLQNRYACLCYLHRNLWPRSRRLALAASQAGFCGIFSPQCTTQLPTSFEVQKIEGDDIYSGFETPVGVVGYALDNAMSNCKAALKTRVMDLCPQEDLSWVSRQRQEL